MNDSAAFTTRKAMLRGGVAASAPGLVAVVAATTAAESTVSGYTVSGYTGLSSMGMAALGVVFFFLAFLFARSRWWAGLPGLICSALAICFFGAKASRLLILYYRFNPIRGFADLTAPFSVISLHLCLMIISGTLGWFIVKTMRLSRSIGPAPVSKHVWVVLVVWAAIVLWQGAIPS